MSEKTFCQTIHVATMAVSLFVLRQVYEIGAPGWYGPLQPTSSTTSKIVLLSAQREVV